MSDSHPWLAPPPEPRGDALERARALLGALNAERSEGGCCGEACFPAAEALALEPALATAAERYAAELSTRAALDHTGEMGDSAFDRMRAAGFRGCAMGENLARGSLSVSEVLRGWLDSEEHCANVREPRFTVAGVAYYNEGNPSSSPVWVLTLGTK